MSTKIKMRFYIALKCKENKNPAILVDVTSKFYNPPEKFDARTNNKKRLIHMT
jgi:hypothetical protein